MFFAENGSGTFKNKQAGDTIQFQTGVAAVQTDCDDLKVWNCIATEDSSQLIAQEYDAIVFLSTTGDILNEGEQNTSKSLSKKGVVLSASMLQQILEEEWDWFNENVLGAQFSNDTIAVKPLDVDVVVRNHPSTTHLEGNMAKSTDEWYVYDRIPENVTILLTQLKTKMAWRPIAWCRK